MLFCGGLDSLEVGTYSGEGRWLKAVAGRASRGEDSSWTCIFSLPKPASGCWLSIRSAFSVDSLRDGLANEHNLRKILMKNSDVRLQQLSCSNLDILRGKCYSLFRNSPRKGWCLGASTKPKRCYEVLGSVFKCSQDAFLLEVSLLVVFCPSQFSGWCTGQPLVLARGRYGRWEWSWWGSLRFTPKYVGIDVLLLYWCRSLGGHSQGHFSGHCLAWSSGARHLREPQHTRHFWWPEASGHQESLLVSTWWKRGQKGCFVLDHWVCLKFAAGIKCVGLPHHTWLHLLVVLSLRRAYLSIQ